MPVGKNKSSKKSNAAIDDKPLETVPGTETETPAGNNGKAAESLQDADDTSGQYVTFFLQDESFAFPMADVREIVRVPTTVDVPLTSHTLVGLANLRGSVLPILDLRRLLIIDENDFTDATRVIVADCKGVAVGLIVDRVARVISVDEDSIETAESMRSTINAEMMTGVVKNVEGYDLIQLLDADQIVSNEFSSVLSANETAQDALSAAKRSVLSTENEEDNSTQLVSFVVDDQEYGFDIQHVEEIVRLPDDISSVPQADFHVIGIINLRDSVLPLVNLRTMFKLERQPLSETNRILVVNVTTADGQRSPVGIVVDYVREVLRITEDSVDKVPTMLSQGDDLNDIVGICRLDGGKRLVSILSSDALFDNPAVREAFKAHSKTQDTEETMNEHESSDDIEDGEETQLVVFHLGQQEFGISIEAVQEITRVPQEMNVVPKTADFVEGMVNLRGAVLPVMDMRSRFGMEKMGRSDRQRILVLDLKGSSTGFITDAVAEVLRLSKRLIEDAPNLSEEQAKVMGRVVNLKEQNRMIQVLDASQLLAQNELQVLSKAG